MLIEGCFTYFPFFSYLQRLSTLWRVKNKNNFFRFSRSIKNSKKRRKRSKAIACELQEKKIRVVPRLSQTCKSPKFIQLNTRQKNTRKSKEIMKPLINDYQGQCMASVQVFWNEFLNIAYLNSNVNINLK